MSKWLVYLTLEARVEADSMEDALQKAPPPPVGDWAVTSFEPYEAFQLGPAE